MKSLFALAAGGRVLAGLVPLLLVVGLVLVIPGGLGILTLELERLRRGVRHGLTLLGRARPVARSESAGG